MVHGPLGPNEKGNQLVGIRCTLKRSDPKESKPIIPPNNDVLGV